MNDHQSWRDALAYYHGLPAHERRAVDDHLAGCEECRTTLAAYDRQDVAVAAIPAIRPVGRRWQPRQAPPAARWLNLFGQALALGGIALLLWMFDLQAQYASQAGAGNLTSGIQAQLVPETGIAIPPAVVSLPSPWLPALPWLGGALLAVGLLFAISGRQRWTVVAGAVLAAGLLLSFVPPFSALPNPAGLYGRLAGGYSYDPNLPFKNDFLIAGRRTRCGPISTNSLARWAFLCWTRTALARLPDFAGGLAPASQPHCPGDHAFYLRPWLVTGLPRALA
jgi:hypothetical protein